MSKILSSLNLNLINVLDVLLTERNTTAAAKKLFLTQPAISYSLKQLREIFNDELLVKNSFNSKMFLTPLAKSLVIPVKITLQNMEKVLTMNNFDPSESRRCFKIAITDYCINTVLKKLLPEIRKSAPSITFDINDINYHTIKKELEYDEIDIAIGGFDYGHKRNDYIYESILESRFVCCADKSHPAFQKEDLDLKEYMKYPHMVVKITGENYTFESQIINDYINTGNITNLSIHNTTELLSLLPDSNFIAIGLKELAYKYAAFYDLATRELPFKVDDYHVSLCIHSRRKDDNGLQWLINKIRETVSATSS